MTVTSAERSAKTVRGWSLTLLPTRPKSMEEVQGRTVEGLWRACWAVVGPFSAASGCDALPPRFRLRRTRPRNGLTFADGRVLPLVRPSVTEATWHHSSRSGGSRLWETGPRQLDELRLTSPGRPRRLPVMARNPMIRAVNFLTHPECGPVTIVRSTGRYQFVFSNLRIQRLRLWDGSKIGAWRRQAR
jgi:hypothetical protein